MGLDACKGRGLDFSPQDLHSTGRSYQKRGDGKRADAATLSPSDGLLDESSLRPSAKQLAEARHRSPVGR